MLFFFGFFFIYLVKISKRVMGISIIVQYIDQICDIHSIEIVIGIAIQ